MRTQAHKLCVATAALASVLLASCDQKPADAAKSAGAADQATPTNRVEIPAAVRQNLGITFAKVESRNVARTLRVPGRFELLPTARREYRAAAAGTVEVLVRQYDRVEAGTPLYRLNSNAWREVQGRLADAEAQVRIAQAGVDSIAPLMAAHEHHHGELEKTVGVWQERVTSLEALLRAGGARGDEVAQARGALASAKSNLAETMEKEADLVAREREASARLSAAALQLEVLLQSAAMLTGASVEELRSVDKATGNAAWNTYQSIEVRAKAAGVVERVDAISGTVVEEHGVVIVVVQPEALRFRATGLQSDLARLSSGTSASVVMPGAGSGASIAGTVLLAPTADAERRTIDLIFIPTLGTQETSPSWARAGVTASLEIVTQGGEVELAIPVRSVVRDGTAMVIFRRDPANPDKAIRMEADLGIDDGRWIVIKSGVAEGNEVVLDGVYQLMVATSGSITKGGHFHPDGTFHEGDH